MYYICFISFLSIFAIQMTSGMPCTPAIPHWVWGPSTIKAVKRRESVLFGIWDHLLNLTCMYVVNMNIWLVYNFCTLHTCTCIYKYFHRKQQFKISICIYIQLYMYIYIYDLKQLNVQIKFCYNKDFIQIFKRSVKASPKQCKHARHNILIKWNDNACGPK